ncbi:MAG: hypothetical protein Ct9H300mP12_05670 [Acidimicrobiales bacterium]|nr:MAG: hypothetical protein Ct9H300mP12_05670 [Acidimicrobiales bacterium]
MLIGKGCHPGPPDWAASRVSPETVATDVAVTLDRMGTDRLDLWLFHRDDVTVPVGELVDAAQREVALGTIEAWGVSNWSGERFWEARTRADVAVPVATSPQFSLVDQLAEPWPGVTTIRGPAHAEERARLADSEISVITWSPLAGGFLTAGGDPSRPLMRKRPAAMTRSEPGSKGAGPQLALRGVQPRAGRHSLTLRLHRFAPMSSALREWPGGRRESPGDGDGTHQRRAPVARRWGPETGENLSITTTVR